MKPIRNIFYFFASFRIVFLHILKGVSRTLLLSALTPCAQQVRQAIVSRTLLLSTMLFSLAALLPLPIALPLLRRRVLCRLSRALPADLITVQKKKQDMLEKIF